MGRRRQSPGPAVAGRRSDQPGDERPGGPARDLQGPDQSNQLGTRRPHGTVRASGGRGTDIRPRGGRRGCRGAGRGCLRSGRRPIDDPDRRGCRRRPGRDLRSDRDYLGFPAGNSGAEPAERSRLQAEKFGVQISVPCRAVVLGERDGSHAITLDSGEELVAGVPGLPRWHRSAGRSKRSLHARASTVACSEPPTRQATAKVEPGSRRDLISRRGEYPITCASGPAPRGSEGPRANGGGASHRSVRVSGEGGIRTLDGRNRPYRFSRPA